VNASMTNAALIPNQLTSAPPRAAPTASITDQVDPLRALAVTRSLRGVSEGMMALRAGSKNPASAISTTASVYRSHKSPTSSTSRNPSTTTKRSTSLVIMMVLRSIRSTSTPASGLTKKIGRSFAIMTEATAVPVPLSFRTSV